MKTEAIKAMGNVMTNSIKSAVKAEAPVAQAVKGGEKLMAAGQDAAAVQGRAMVKPYVKPEMQVVKLEKENLRAASGYDGGKDVDSDLDFQSVDDAAAVSPWDKAGEFSVWE